MPRAKANGVEIEYDTFGDPAAPALLLVMGLGAQMIAWDEELCERLVERGFFVIRYDNRDIGLSTKFDDGPQPALTALLSGDGSSAPYLLADMADDAVGLLDALGIARAHIVGASMGGMIVQSIAIAHPERVLSVCSVMSTTGARDVGQPTPEAMGALLVPPADSREQAIEQSVAGSRVISSTGYPFDEERVRERAGAAYDRSYNPAGMGRQLAAILASPDRTEALGHVELPTVVIHGDIDPLVTLSGGQATAAAIPGAELLVMPGMGHDLPLGLWGSVVDAIAKNAERATGA